MNSWKDEFSPFSIRARSPRDLGSSASNSSILEDLNIERNLNTILPRLSSPTESSARATGGKFTTPQCGPLSSLTGSRSAFRVGMEVVTEYLLCPGQILWIGCLPGRGDELFAGIELREEFGISDGKFEGMQYFKCMPKRGVFLPIKDLKPSGQSVNDSVLDSSRKFGVRESVPIFSGEEAQRDSALHRYSQPVSRRRLPNDGLLYLQHDMMRSPNEAENHYYMDRVINSDLMPSLKEIFNNVDKDGDGFISREELSVYFSQFYLVEESMSKILEILQIQNSKIDFASFSKIISFILFEKFKHIRRKWPEDYSLEVFLGGACGITKWRETLAIPIFREAGITFYNPQLEDWKPDMVVVEAIAKEKCAVLLFVVGSETRGIASMIEATQFICEGREVVLVLEDVIEGFEISGESIHPLEAKDLNRGRAYIADVARRWSTPTFSNVRDACIYCVTLIRERKNRSCAVAEELYTSP